MRQLVIAIGLVMLTAACASPWANKKRTVTKTPPRVIVATTPAEVNTTTTPAEGDYAGTYPMAGGGSATDGSSGSATTTSSGAGASSTPMTTPQRNPVPGSAREYINRHSNSGAMAK